MAMFVNNMKVKNKYLFNKLNRQFTVTEAHKSSDVIRCLFQTNSKAKQAKQPHSHEHNFSFVYNHVAAANTIHVYDKIANIHLPGL